MHLSLPHEKTLHTDSCVRQKSYSFHWGFVFMLCLQGTPKKLDKTLFSRSSQCPSQLQKKTGRLREV